MPLNKNGHADLRKRYPLFVEIGLLASLTLLIVAFRMDFAVSPPEEIDLDPQETIAMEEIDQTEQIEEPPPPERPPVPVAVPDETALDNEDLDLDVTLDLNEDISNVLGPPPEEEEEEPTNEPEVFIIVEERPAPIGGMAALQRRVEYPDMARRAGVEGTVSIQFVVDEEGNVHDPVVVKSLGAGCDEAAMKAILATKFTPGSNRGNPVKVKMVLPVRFRLR